MLAAITSEKLSKAQSRSARTNQEDGAANFGSDAVHAVNGAGCSLEKSRFFPAQVLEFEDLFGGIDAIFSKSTINYF